MSLQRETLDATKIDFRKYCFWGAVLNAATIAPFYPLRTVRLLQQSKQAVPVSNSISTVVRDVARTRGVKALFGGATVFTFGLTATKIINFGTYDLLRGWIARDNHKWNIAVLHNQNFVSSIVGSLSACLTCVSQQITIAKAGNMAGMTAHKMTISQALKAQFQQEGVRFLFRGYVATLFSTMPYFAAYFPAYEVSKWWVRDGIEAMRAGRDLEKTPDPFPPARSHQFIVSSVAGCIASMVGVFASAPMDIVRVRIQTEQRLQAPSSSSGSAVPALRPPPLKWMAVFKDIVRNEGWLALFRGFSARAMLSVPGGALNFIIFDFVRSISMREDVPAAPAKGNSGIDTVPSPMLLRQEGTQ
ncbi:hypothetical protein DFQ27_000830 [Actinomortierella ambigua]|uniref:Mitochondrial carrier protein n=1 Tax=Actinomortierella ambigua TaxID=1343610 RepID=A0A9P6U8F9_9FUNG|nr:hypothetical protein DFQ27_000830 [Actinomortierella ambigua]